MTSSVQGKYASGENLFRADLIREFISIQYGIHSIMPLILRILSSPLCTLSPENSIDHSSSSYVSDHSRDLPYEKQESLIERFLTANS